MRMHRMEAIPGKWLVCAALVIAALGASYWPDAAGALRYDRSAILSGEIWRLATAHLVHMNTPHLVMNLLALALLCELLWHDMNVRYGAGLVAVSALGIGVSLLVLNPELAWYVGLSGVLHGLWGGCALQGCRLGKLPAMLSVGTVAQWVAANRLPIAALMLLCLKLALESHYGPAQRTERAIGGRVIAVAHAYGAFSGLAYALAWRTIGWVRDVAMLRFRLK